MVTRVGGLASGMDIDSIVEKLMSAEKAPLTKLYQQQTKYEWERDAYREINTALSSFDDYLFDNYRLSSNFYKKTVSSTNSSLVTATATSAAIGSLSIEGVSQLATSARSIGTTINATSKTTMQELLSSSNPDSTFTDRTIKLNAIQKNGELATTAASIEIKATDTVENVVNKINASGIGVTAVFESGKLSISAQNTGSLKQEGAAEVIVESETGSTSGTAVAAGTELFSLFGLSDNKNIANGGSNAIFTINGIATERSSNTFSINGYDVTLNSTFNKTATNADILQSTKDQYDFAHKNTETAKAELDAAFANLGNLSLEGSINNIIGTTSDDGLVLKNYLLNMGSNGPEKLDAIFNLSISSSFTVAEIDTQLETLKNSNPVIFTDADIKSLRSVLITKGSDGTESPSNTNNGYLQGLEDTKGTNTSQQILDVFGKDLAYSEAVLNKEEAFTSFSEAYNLNKGVPVPSGLKNYASTEQDYKDFMSGVDSYVEANSSTQDSPVTLTSSTDVDNMVDKIKKFVETYNGLVTTINGKLKETYNRNYPPLTDEQKEEMSEDEIEKWEKKAQTGLLRNDSILTNGLYAMRRTFTDAVGGLGDDTINSLAEIGITTSSTTSDGGKLVINEDKLRTAIEKNADQVASIFTKTGTAKDASKGVTEDTRGIAQRLRDELKGFTGEIEKKAGKASSTNQSYTIGKRLDEMKTRIDAWVDKLENIESRYWKQFTAMETAINKANSQSSIFQTGY
ncbi:flagellar filament capping protein FliD [Ureibacillus aquaedulcis]|uniref:Flagellar hook-associated protein 2 n=1 Tax=Ureibacillus aquaedulcis TaxID=3058421 RepID=A0ABT8GLD3_9BACL|nr:flagellar filament capping protein FliD [Ureibacillus sp. BA0131]MDN4492225.1 flagellar filament capping protein FliD [Ureibacillus sp. BA0131]